MALKTAGVILEAQNAQQYYAAMTRASQATDQFTRSVVGGAREASIETQRLSGRISDLSGTIDIQKRRYDILQQELDETAQKYGSASIQAQRKQLSLDRLGGSIQSNEGKLRLYKNELDSASASGGRFKNALENMNKGAQMYLGAAMANLASQALSSILSFVAGSIDAAGKFESQMNRFASVTGQSLQQSGIPIQQFKDLFLKMGADTQYSANQAAQAAVELAKGGLTPAAIAGGALASTLALAAAGELDLAEAATITAKQLGIWADTGIESADVANLMAQAANASTVNVDDLALGLAQAGGVAKVAGLDFQEVVTTMAELSPGFYSASDAGTSFKSFLNNLQPTTKPAIAAMTDLGLYTQEAGSAFYDAQGNFVGMEKASQLLHDATNGLSQAQRSLALETIFGADAQRAAAIIAEKGAAGYQEMARQMQLAGSATDQAKTKQQGYAANIEQLKGSLETLQITLGEKVLPAVTDFVQGLTIAVNAIMDVVGGVEQFFAASEKLDQVHQRITQGAASFDAYSKSIDGVNEQLPWYVSDIERLNRPQYEFAQALLKTGVAADEVASRTEKIRGLSSVIDRMMIAMKDNAPASYEALDRLDTAMLRVSERGQPFATGIDLALNRLRMTGDVQAFESAIRSLETAYTASQQPAQTMATNIQAFTSSSAAATDAAMRYAVNVGGPATQATQQFSAAVKVSEDDLKAQQKALQSVMQAGPKAMADIANTQAQYMVDSETRLQEHEVKLNELRATGNQQMIDQENARYLAEQQAADTSYAQQQAAQRRHLGQMLIDYINAKAITDEQFRTKSADMIAAISNEYGIVADLATMSFGQQMTAIDSYVASGSADISTLTGTLKTNEQQLVNNQLKTQQYTEDAITKLRQMKDDGLITSEEYIAALEKIPSEVTTKIMLEDQEAQTKAYQVGRDLMAGIVKGIKDSQSQVDYAVEGVIDSSMRRAKEKAGIHSPSTLFAIEIGQPISDGIADGITSGGSGIEQAIGQVMDRAQLTAEQKAEQMRAAIESSMGLFANKMGGDLSGGISIVPPGRASGGPVSAGMPYIVGERGPELFMPSQSGAILPSQQTASLMAASRPNITTSTSTATTNNYNYSPTYGGAPSAPAYDFMMMAARAQ